MAEPTTRLADPRDGFFDIKPAPEFYPPDYSLLWVLLALFLLSIALFLLLLWNRRKEGGSAQQPLPTPREQFAFDLERIRKARSSESITVREFASELSLATRRFIQSRFGFPATDRTVTETLELLTPRLSERATGPSAEVKALLKELKALLRSLERTTFAGRDAERLSIGSEELAVLLTQSEAMVDSLERLLRIANEADLKPGEAAA